MAIKRVWGTVDGIEVALLESRQGEYAVEVPLDVDGEYVIEIFAEDSAGNTNYMAKLLYTVCAGNVVVRCLQQTKYRLVRQDTKALFTLIHTRKEGRCDQLHSRGRPTCKI